MPGHVKKSSGPDPDPSKWLFLSFELKEKLKVTFIGSSTSHIQFLISIIEQAVRPKEVLLGPGQGHRGLQWGPDRVHWGGEGDGVREGRGMDWEGSHMTQRFCSEKSLEEGSDRAGQPSQVRLLHWYVQLDLPQRRLRPLELEDQIRQRAHLHLFRPFLYRRQPVQGILNCEMSFVDSGYLKSPLNAIKGFRHPLT